MSLQPTTEQIAAIRAIPHLASGGYRDLDIAATIAFYKARYVDQLKSFAAVNADTIIADAGAGYGWLAIAFAMHTPAHVIAIEADAARAAAGQEICRILNLENRIDWRTGALGALGSDPPVADIVYCIEVLEHVRGDPRALSDLAAMTRSLLIVTTPNKWFPVIAHDTRLPFCHWLPLPARRVYAALCKRSDRENDNMFWSPASLGRHLPGFRRVSGFLHYARLADYLATYPFYLPYNGGMTVERPGRLKRLYYGLSERLGTRSAYVLPNLAGVYRRES